MIRLQTFYMKDIRDNLPENVVLVSNPILIPFYTHRRLVQTNDLYHNNIKIFIYREQEVKSKEYTFDSQKTTQELLLTKIIEEINCNFDNCSMYLYEYIYDYNYEDFDDFGSHWLDNICFYKTYQLSISEEVIDNYSLALYFIIKGLADIE